MEAKTQNTESKNLKKLEEAELTVTMFDQEDVVATSDGSGDITDITCLARGTKITMADGSFKNVEDINEGDMVMTFDHESGCFIDRKVILTFRSDDKDCIFSLLFSNGTKIQFAHTHCLYEQESRKYVYFTMSNAEQYIGKHFYSAMEKDYVELISVTRESEMMDYYEIYTGNSYNTIANGMLNVSEDVGYMLNIYEFDENLKADEEVLADDLKKYGVFEYSEKYGYSKEEYDALNMRYLNIAVGKGLVTWDKLWKQHLEYIAHAGSEAAGISA